MNFSINPGLPLKSIRQPFLLSAKVGTIGNLMFNASLKAPSLKVSKRIDSSSGTPPSGNIQTLKPLVILLGLQNLHSAF
jgi:hypothetical protein